MDEAEVIDPHLLFEDGAVDLLGLAELDRVLNAGVEKNAVDFWVSGCDSGDLNSASNSTICVVQPYSSTNPGMLPRSPMSSLADAALCSPYSWTKASRRSCRRPTAMTFDPSLIRRLAMACPMPEVAPTTRTCL